MIRNELMKNTTIQTPSVTADGGQSHTLIPQPIITDNMSACNLTDVAFPDELRQTGKFCCWHYEERDSRKTKVPYNPVTSERARSNDPNNFAFYAAAHQTQCYDCIGIGIFDGICAVDLDNCIDDAGRYSPIAAEIVTLLHSYTELSPSGKGLHILFRAAGFVYDVKQFYIMNRTLGIEVYVAGCTNKYVTVTVKSCESHSFGERGSALQQLLDKYMKRPLPNSQPTARNAKNAVNSGFDAETLLNMAKSSQNGKAFSKLWNGSTDGFPSQSEAVLALCSHLAFWTGKDTEQMDALFRKSCLMRDKWDRIQAGTTYGALTIQKAIDACHEVYTPKAKKLAFPEIVPLTPQSSNLPLFPIDDLPDVLRQYVSAVAEHSQTSPDMAAVIGLGVLAVCLQGKFLVQGMPGYCEPLSLYTVVIAAPGVDCQQLIGQKR